MAQDIPAPEMEALLLANIDVTEDAIRELAVQRGVAVKDYLSGQKLPVGPPVYLGEHSASLYL